jgi:hypothetical protein
MHAPHLAYLPLTPFAYLILLAIPLLGTCLRICKVLVHYCLSKPLKILRMAGYFSQNRSSHALGLLILLILLILSAS